MTDAEALMRTVLERPEDDVSRLVYADWLEENAGTVPCGACGGTGHERWSCKVCGAEPRDDGTEAAARTALSLALVNWARREAGLPPLTPSAA